MADLLNKKTGTYAIITVLTALVVLFTIISNILQKETNDCNTECQIMLINKTQNYLEAQKILIERAQAVCNRAGYIAKGDAESVNAYNEDVETGYNKYQSFVKSMIDFEDKIKGKMSDCSSKNFWANNSSNFTLILASITFIVSVHYFMKYLNDK